jgi:ferric-dicitrate binding protein FerR (iron transport regulator)
MMNRNIPLDELAKQLELMADDFQNPFIASASSRLAHVAAALTCLQDALFYVRMYQCADTTGEGEKRRQQLIDDSETIINLIRTGGLYP